MSDDIFNLGFSVDTSGLAQGKASAADMAKALLELAKAMQAEEAAAKKAGDADRKKAEEQRKAAEEARRAADPHLRLADAMGKIGQQAQGVSGHINGLTQGFMQAGASLSQGGAGGLLGGMNSMLTLGGRMVPMMGGMAAGAASLAVGVGAVAVAYAGLIAATYKQQEAFMMLEGRLKNVYGSGSVAAEMFGKITDLANKNGLAIDATAESFLRLARNNEAIGLTRDQMVDLTDAVQMLGRVSGASQGEVAGGLMQFSQALAAGRLNGDELRSIMENMPALAKGIADGLGVSVGQLRAMGAEGQLTSDKITGALLGQLPKIREEFDNLPQTSEQAFQRVGNAWDSLIAHIGDRLNSSGIVTGTFNALADVINGADEMVRPETPEEAYRRIMASRQKGLGNNGWMSLMDPYNASAAQDDKELQTVLDQLEAKRKLAMADRLREQKDMERAPFVRAQGLLKETDDFSNKLNELQANLKSFQAARDKLSNSKNGIFEKEELAKLAEFDRLIATTKAQIEDTILPLEKYARATDRMAASVARYGAGGAASIGAEAQGLVDASVASQHPISYEQAESEVIRKRTLDVQTQTQAMDQQIVVQQRLQEAIGGGTDAQIEAEVANKALTLQLQLFGTALDDDASKALDGYKEKLRELLQIQNDTTAAQKLYNAELQLGIEAQITAAIKAGATAGEIAALRRNLQLGADLSQAGGGNFPASLLTTESGGNIHALNKEGYGGRLQFGDDRLADAARAGIIPLMTGAQFSQQPLSVQQAVENWHFADIDSQASSRGLTKYVGQSINGTTITQNSIRAMAHLGGIGGAQSYLESGGTIDPADSNGTRLSDYARIHAGGSVGQQAVAAEAELAAQKSAQTLEARIAQLEKEAADLRDRSSAKNLPEAERIKREQQIRDAGDAAENPADRKRIEDAMRAKLAAEDDAKVQERLRAIDQETDLMKQQAALAKLPPREREIEARVLEEVNRLKQQGIELDEAGIAAIRKKVAGQQEVKEDAAKVRGVWESAAEAIGGSLEEAISQAMKTGKVEAEDILTGLLADITSALTRAFIIQPLVDGLKGMWGAQGLVTGPGGASMFYAAGGVIDKPTPLYAGPRMMAIGGEAGPEAVLPLKRGPDGKLGVGAGSGGGGTQIVVNDMRSAQGAEPVDVQESTGPDGQRMISIMVRDEVRRQVRNGDLDKEMRSSFGVSRQLTRR